MPSWFSNCRLNFNQDGFGFWQFGSEVRNDGRLKNNGNARREKSSWGQGWLDNESNGNAILKEHLIRPMNI